MNVMVHELRLDMQVNCILRVDVVLGEDRDHAFWNLQNSFQGIRSVKCGIHSRLSLP